MASTPTPPQPSEEELYRSHIERGKKMVERLRSPGPTPISLSTTQLESWYRLRRGRKTLPAEDELKLALGNFDVSLQDLEYVEVSARDPKAHLESYVNWFHARDGYMVNWFNWKDNDTNEESEKLYPSEAIWQSYLLAGRAIASFDPSSLRLIVRSSVINDSARRAIFHAATLSASLVQDPSSGYAEYGPGQDGYYAILGSDNGANSMRLLIDHKRELRGRTVEKVIVVGAPAVNGILVKDNPKRARTFLLVLSEREN